MRSTSGVARILIGLVMLAGGCAKLNDEKSYELALGEEKLIVIDPFKREQKVHVQVTATNGMVDVFVCLEKDQEEAQVAFSAKKNDKILASSSKTGEAKLEATVPANSAALVYIANAGGNKPGEKTAVKVKIHN